MNPNIVGNEGGDGLKASLVALRGMVLAALLLSACGSESIADVGDVVPDAAGQSASVEPLGLMRVEAAGVSSRADWETWFAKPWQARDSIPAAFDAVRFVCTDGDCTAGERLEVSSCALLFEADSSDLDVQGMEAPQAGYLYRRLVCYAGRALAVMQDATTSHVSGYVLEAGTLAELPAELGYPGSPAELADARRMDEEGGALGVFLEQVLGISDASAIQTIDGGLRIDDEDNWTREWVLMGRGDLDGDGVEDLLVGVNLYITDEALRFGSRLYAVTRDEAGAPMRVAYQVPIRGVCSSETTPCANFLLPEMR